MKLSVAATQQRQASFFFFFLTDRDYSSTYFRFSAHVSGFKQIHCHCDMHIRGIAWPKDLHLACLLGKTQKKNLFGDTAAMHMPHSYCFCSILQLQCEFWWIVGWQTIKTHVWQKRHNLTIYTVWVEIRPFEICKPLSLLQWTCIGLTTKLLKWYHL